MDTFLIIRHNRGRETRISQRSWDLMPKSQKADYQVVGKITDIKGAAAMVPSAAKQPERTGFIPPEIVEAERLKEEEKKAVEAITGEAVKEEVQEAPAPAIEAGNEAPEVKEAPEADDLATIGGITKATVEVLKSIGITTFAQLAKADAGKVGAALEAANLSAKKAQVPNWKAKAETLAKG